MHGFVVIKVHLCQPSANVSEQGPWSEHGTAWYSCNRYDEKGGIDARDAQSKSRASLERYLHVRIIPPEPFPVLTTAFLHSVLQSLGEPRTVGQALIGSVREDGKEDGGHADLFGSDLD